MRFRLIPISIITIVFSMMLVAPAAAHVTANPDTAAADSYSMFGLRVAHGCEDSPTTEVAVQIPSGIVSATPEQMPGWTASTVTGELDEPYESHGEMVSEGVVEVVWTADAGNALPSDQFLDFGLSVRLGDIDEQTLYLPTVQTCEDGEHPWIEIPGEDEEWNDLDSPAPYLEVVAGGGDHNHGDDDATGTTDDADDPAGSVAVAADGEDNGASNWISIVIAVVALLVAIGAFVGSRRPASA